MSLARGAAITEGSNGDHVATPRMGDIHLPRPARPPLWRRVVARFFSSVVLHLLVLVAILYGYNRAVYAYRWVTSRPPPYFSDVAAPLYAQLEDWVANDLMPTESANWPQFWFDVRTRLHWIAPPAIVFAGWTAIVVAQLATRRYLAGWAMSLLLIPAALTMNLTVAMVDGGPTEVLHPFSRYGLEYYTDVPWVRDAPREFVREYPTISRQRLTHHARTHPPGPVLFLWLVRRYLGPGLTYASLAAIVVTTLGAVPAYWLARDRLGPTDGLIVAGMYVLAPSLVLFGATCMDGVFLVLPVTGMWLLCRAVATRSGLAVPGLAPPVGATLVSPGAGDTSVAPTRGISQRNSGRQPIIRSIYAILAGLVLAGAAFMTYATACVGVIFALYAIVQLFSDVRGFARTAMMLLLAALAFAGGTYLLHATLDYNPFACVTAAMQADDAVVGRVRAHYVDVGFANLVAFLIGAGAIASTLWLRQVARESWRAITLRRPDPLTFAFFAAILVLSFARLFTLEVERIWMFLVPLVLVAAARELTTIGSPKPSRLAVRVGMTMLLLFLQTWITEIVLYTWW